MNILFFIGTLTTGGAERQMSMLAKGMAERGHKVIVVTVWPGGQIARDLSKASRVTIMSLWSNRGGNIIIRLLQILLSPVILRRSMKSTDYLYSMLEVTNFIAWLATRFKRNTCLIWGIRSSNMEGHWKMALFDKLCTFLSPTVKLLIVNSHAGLECLLKRGYRPQRYEVILNGIDTEKFQYSEDGRRKIRHELDVSIKQPLVGIVARLNPKKDHPTFLKAAALVVQRVADVKFLCVGGGPTAYAEELYALVNELGLKDRVIWLGDRSDVVDIYIALDILASSSSYGEGFPNVIGEAMSCGVPCVVTDVGDSASIVADPAQVVEPRNPEKLSQTIIKLLGNTDIPEYREMIRDRIEKRFSLKTLIDITEQKLREVR